MSDNGYDIWRDVANILVNPNIKTEMGYRFHQGVSKESKFEYYNPELREVGSRKMILPLLLLPLAKRRNYQRRALLQSKKF